MSVNTCPGCGAPIEGNPFRCQYCAKVLNPGQDWTSVAEFAPPLSPENNMNTIMVMICYVKPDSADRQGQYGIWLRSAYYDFEKKCWRNKWCETYDDIISATHWCILPKVTDKRWISVEEHLPGLSGEDNLSSMVLACYVGEYFILSFSGAAYDFNDKKWLMRLYHENGESPIVYREVSHWMPLPPMPSQL